MQQNFLGQKHLRNALDVLNCADFVVHGHYRDEQHCLINHIFEGIQFHETFAVHGDDVYGEPFAFRERPCCSEHALVFDGTNQDPSSPRRSAAGETKYRQVICFGSTGREHDLVGISSDKAGDR